MAVLPFSDFSHESLMRLGIPFVSLGGFCHVAFVCLVGGKKRKRWEAHERQGQTIKLAHSLTLEKQGQP